MDQNSNELYDIGYLNIDVRTNLNFRPVPGARVTISRAGTDIEALNTDSAGQTVTIELGTPPMEFSQEVLGMKPYTEYNLQIEADGFDTVVVNGVQLLPEQTAIQNVLMRESTGEGEIRRINIEQHSLWGTFPPKIEEPEVKPLPTGDGFVVLPEPVIPEFMVVHLGQPSDTSAQNVWIPFKDYITNVACSEIYSTWPDNTIRANVLAILSFALNRVFTEWYRGKGYDFTITNSTALDMMFVYGRNIFGNVANIVNDIFTTYITRPGIRQPLLTQFCDGSRVSCNGLEQWGSKAMGAGGSDSLTILRNYYGTDIYLAQAEKVEGIPLSFPGTILQVGSRGEYVRTIQQQLNSISNNFPMIQKIRVDGIFGEQTKNAVKTFQQIFNLPVTGAVDFSTWYQISNIYVAVNRLAELS